MRNMLIIFLLSTFFAFTGCANWASVWRTHSADGVKIASLDAKQRLFITSKNEIDKWTKFCSEPSPDALASLASGFGFGISIPEKAASSLSNALSESSTNIGLRTQSITMLRDMLYRVCEAARNGDLNELMVAQLHTRYQDVMLGVLAVEQLTGAVVPRQVILGGNSSAVVTADTLIGLTEKLEEAEAYEAKKKAKKEEVQKIVDTLEKKDEPYEGSVAEAAANKKSSEEKQKKNEEALKHSGDKIKDIDCKNTKNEDQIKLCKNHQNLMNEQEKNNKEVEEADKALTKKEKELENAQEELERAEKQYEAAKENTDLINKMKGQAATRADAAAITTGQFAPGEGYEPINKDVAKEVANTVESIVKTIVNKPHEVETCLVFLLNLRETEQHLDKLREERKKLEGYKLMPGDSKKPQNQEISAIDNRIKSLQESYSADTSVKEFCLNIISNQLNTQK